MEKTHILWPVTPVHSVGILTILLIKPREMSSRKCLKYNASTNANTRLSHYLPEMNNEEIA